MSVYKVEGKCVRDQFGVVALEAPLGAPGNGPGFGNISGIRPGGDLLIWGWTRASSCSRENLVNSTTTQEELPSRYCLTKHEAMIFILHFAVVGHTE